MNEEQQIRELQEKTLWHKLRGENVGGSEIAVLFGESSYMSYYQLWHIKHGNILPDDLDNVERIQAGNFLEEGAIKWHNHVFGTNFFQPHQYFLHKTVKGAACTPDACCPSGTQIAQVKNVDSLQFLKKWEVEGKIIKKIPVEIELQCQYEMEVCDVEENVLIVIVGGNRLFSITLQRDRKIGEILIEGVKKFWKRKEAPEPDFEKDEETISKLRKESKLKPTENLSENNYLHKLCKKSMSLTLKKRKAEDELKIVNSEIAYLVGSNENTACKKYLINLPKNKKTPKILSTEDIF